MPTDPTLQTKGCLRVALKMDVNVSLWEPNSYKVRGLPVALAGVTYGPPSAPPAAWTNGTQYRSGSGTIWGAMGPEPNGGHIMQAGVLEVLSVKDMSAATVLPGKTYAFMISFGGVNWIQVYTKITGGQNGSTLLPGFGIWNLKDNPNAWTYMTPPEPFTGEWMIGIHASFISFAPLWLSVEYAPPMDYGKGDEARLVFTCRGSQMLSKLGPSGTVEATEDEREEAGGFQYLHARSRVRILQPEDTVPAE